MPARATLSVSLVVLVIAGVAERAEAQRRRRQAEPGTLVIQTTAEGAEVLVDEESVGFTPLAEPIEVTPGSHTVRVRRPGYTEFTDVVRVRPGEQVELPVDLMALAMVLTVRSDPDEARVFVDDTYRGTTPIELELIEGEHSLRVTHPRHRESVRQVNAVAGQTEAIDVELEPLPESELQPRAPEWYEEPAVWIAVGGGAVAVAVVIIVVAVLTQSDQRAAQFCEGAQTCLDIVPMGWRF